MPVMRTVTGLRAWLVQRFSAIFMLLITIALVIVFLSQDAFTYEQWVSFMRHPVSAMAGVLFFLAMLIHAWVGMRDIIMDYVHSLSARVILLVTIALTLIAMGLWAIHILLLPLA